MPPKKKVETEKLAAVEKAKPDLIALVKSKHPKAKISEGSSYHIPWYTDRYPTGIISLDAATGGGIPPSGITEVIGPEGVGKTFLTNRTMALAQAQYGSNFCGFAAVTEGRYDKLFARFAGMRVALSDEEIEAWEDARKEKLSADWHKELKTQIGRFYEVTSPTREELFETIIDLSKTGEFHIGVLDSIKAGESVEDADRGVGEKTRAEGVKANSDLVNRLMTTFVNYDSKLAMILINQFRVKMDASTHTKSIFSKMEITGGHMVKHLKLLTIALASESSYYEGEGKTSVQLGKNVTWKIMKGKANCHDGVSGGMVFRFDSGYDYLSDAVNCGIQTGHIVLSGSWCELHNDAGELVSDKVQGQDKLRAALQDNPEVLESIRSKYFNQRGIFIRYGRL